MKDFTTNSAINATTKTSSYVNPHSPFGATYKMFSEYLGYDEENPLSYEEWVRIPSDRKAAVLYVQFYEQITLAWFKTKTAAATEESAVEAVIQYLMKNVAKIEADGYKFKPQYIYKVAYNCLYCVSIDPYKGQTAANSWYNNTQSQYINVGDDMLDIFDHIPDKSTCHDTFDVSEFWRIIESMGEDTLSVVAKLLGDTSTGKGNAGREFASRKDLTEDSFEPRKLPKVSKKDTEKIIEQLRANLSKFSEIYYA